MFSLSLHRLNYDNMLERIIYKGEDINLEDIELVWIDRFGEFRTGNIDEYASDYALDEMALNDKLGSYYN